MSRASYSASECSRSGADTLIRYPRRATPRPSERAPLRLMVSRQVPAPAPAASADARLTHAFALVADPSVRVVSFDVFDTLLFRAVAEPEDAFELLGARLRE